MQLLYTHGKKKPKTIGTFWMLYYIFVLDYESIINSRKTGKKTFSAAIALILI